MKKLIGNMSVDAGLCWVGDPCYVLGDDASSRVHDWNEFCGLLLNEGEQHKHWSAPPLALTNSLAFHLAINTGFGDGTYPVYIETSDEGAWGERVKSITIEFISDEEEDFPFDVGGEG